MNPRDPRVLLGAWAFDRVVTDRLAGETLTADGTVNFTQVEPGRIRWSERGTLHRGHRDGQRGDGLRGGTDAEVSRELFVVRRPDGWVVTFADDRDFHPWSPDQRVEHLCGADSYRGLADFTGADTGADVDTRLPAQGWTLTWWVRGPRKDYEMVTRLSRRPTA